MKPINTNSGEETAKSIQIKTSKKSTKSRSKPSKSAELGINVKSGAASGSSNSSIINNSMIATTPTTPTTISNSGNLFEATLAAGAAAGSGALNAELHSSNSRNHHTRSYVGIEPRSIKIIWEQHDQSDVELSAEVCARMAEDATYKLWELINNAKIYARHSGGVLTYDLLNEVMRDADVTPALGAMDSDWDRIDYDGSYYFYSDKITELRDEFQKDVAMGMPAGADFTCSWPVEDKSAEILKKYIPSLIYVTFHGNEVDLSTALSEAAFAPFLGSCYRVILLKLIQVLALKQSDRTSARCWRLLQACAVNPCIRDVNCREEYYHLVEILICQLLAPYESIKVHRDTKIGSDEGAEQKHEVKMEIDESKLEQPMDKTAFMEQQPLQGQNTEQQEVFPTSTNTTEEKIYKLQMDDDDEEDENMRDQQQQLLTAASPYFATPVDWKYVDDLCVTIGHLSAISGYFQSECVFNIVRRLERFLEGRQLNFEREFNFLSRAVRGLIAVGEHAFREFIPFAYKFKADDVPEPLWKDFAQAAMFLNGPDDIFLYEWLECLCGSDKLQPYMVYYAQYFENFLTMRFIKRKKATFKINPKVAVRRLEWNTLAAAMCHGDDPNKALKPKPTLSEVFPELAVPNLKLNRAGNIRFKFAGCRPFIIKPKNASHTIQQKDKIDMKNRTVSSTACAGGGVIESQSDIIIARRKLFKPLTNERRVVPLSSYYFVRI